MKIFIIFLGLLLVNVSIMCYKSDYGKYVYLHRLLDNIAYECAEIAINDVHEARASANEMLEYAINNLRGINVRDYKCDIYAENGRAVVRISMDVERLFRFPFLPDVSIILERIRC